MARLSCRIRSSSGALKGVGDDSDGGDVVILEMLSNEGEVALFAVVELIALIDCDAKDG